MKYNLTQEQMTLTDRVAIETGICSKDSFKKIARLLGRHPSTIAHEIKENRTFLPGSYPFGKDCYYARRCTEKHISLYREAGVEFHFGQAQKWLNMMIKYLYMIGECTFDDIFQYLHIPLDNYVFDVAQKELGIKRPKKRPGDSNPPGDE